jgi:DNA-binding NtrC family response regulator
VVIENNGRELLGQIDRSKLKQVVLLTGHPSIKSQINDLSGPSVSYLTKPFDTADLARLLKGSDRNGDVAVAENEQFEAYFGLLVGRHKKMLDVYRQIEQVAMTDSTVLILGETGTGKELIAESVHRVSGRDGDFVPVNCGSLSEELAGSELFGHEKGSFTGAVRKHAGFFQRADGGPLFLDELAEMPIKLQPHLLRVLETGKVLPVGGERDLAVNARIVAATNRDPAAAIADKFLRQDLYYRLSVFPICVPSLRERPSDIPLLANFFVRQSQNGARKRQFSDEALQRLQAYHWPGNVRELKHVVHRASILSPSDSDFLELPKQFTSPFGIDQLRFSLKPGRSIRDVERELIERTLEHFDGDKKAAADVLGISLNTLYNRLNSY